MNYLPLLSAHYECIGTAGLLDSVASADFAETGVVAEITDGKFGNARGPCTGNRPAGNGFSITPSGVFETRHAQGFRLGTEMMWVRFDNNGQDQECSSQANSATANNTQQYVIRAIHQLDGGTNESPLLLIWDHTSNSFAFAITAGRTSSGLMPTGVWIFIGWSIDLNTDTARFFHGIPGEGASYAEGDTSSITAFRATALSSKFLGIGSGFSNEGIDGDLDHADWYSGVAAQEKDFLYFWNNGKGRRYPQGYKPAANSLNYYYR